MFDEFDKFLKISDSYEEPENREYDPTENLQEWLMDRRGRDQFVIRYGDETAVFWNDHQKQLADEVKSRTQTLQCDCDNRLHWQVNSCIASSISLTQSKPQQARQMLLEHACYHACQGTANAHR